MASFCIRSIVSLLTHCFAETFYYLSESFVFCRQVSFSFDSLDKQVKKKKKKRTQVISYPSHFVPFWSLRTHFYFQFGHFVPSSVISYPAWSFRTYFYFFLATRFGHFVPSFYCFVPKSFRTRSNFVPI